MRFGTHSGRSLNRSIPGASILFRESFRFCCRFDARAGYCASGGITRSFGNRHEEKNKGDQGDRGQAQKRRSVADVLNQQSTQDGDAGAHFGTRALDEVERGSVQRVLKSRYE